MKKKLAMIMVTSLLALSLSACGSSSGESIVDSEDAAEAENEAAASGDETQAADETENVESEAVPAEATEAAPAESTEAAPAEGTEAAATEGAEAATPAGPVELEGGSNQVEAVPIALGQQVTSTNEDDSWYSFTTSSNPDSDYQISIINMTGDGSVSVSVRDMLGEELTYAIGDKGGTAATCTPEKKLDANTMYYLHVANYMGGPLDFALIVREAAED